jgi:CHAT domain-containing protein/Tfp pilus assembly protein PilF
MFSSRMALYERGKKRKGDRMNRGKWFFLSLVLAVTVLTGTTVWPKEDSLKMTSELNGDIVQLFQQGKYGEALPLTERLRAIYEKNLGPDHPSTATALNNIAFLYYSMGDYDKAEPLFMRSLTIREKSLGPNHPATVASLNSLAELYRAMGVYGKAASLCMRILAIREKVLGPDHRDTAQALSNLALLYESVGTYDKAEPLYMRALAIREKAMGKKHPDIVPTLNSLAELYRMMGACDKAEPLYKRVLAIKEAVLKPDHHSIASVLSNLGLLYENMGAYDKAEPLYKRALEIEQNVLGPEHFNVFQALSHLAGLYRTMGAYDKAEPLYSRALTMSEKILGPDHPDTALAMSNLGLLYESMGERKKAEPLYKQALEIKEKALGPDHPSTAISLNGLASLYESMRSYKKAEPLYRRALTINMQYLVSDHFDKALSLKNLTGSYASNEGDKQPHARMERTQRGKGKHIEQLPNFDPEIRQEELLSTTERALHIYFNLIRQRFFDDEKVIRHALDVWLAGKGILFEAQMPIQDVLTAGNNVQAQDIITKLTGVRQEFARLLSEGLGKEDSETYQKRITELTTQKESLEEQLGLLNQAFVQQRKPRTATTSTLASVLPQGSVLIEMARIKDFDFKTRKWGSSRYLAFVLSSEKDSDVSFFDLGEAENIDRKMVSYKKSLVNSKALPEILLKQSNELYNLVFAPMAEAVGDSRQLFLSPDESLNLIPFEILRDNMGHYLIETHTFHYVSAGRDIAGYGTSKEEGRKALLLGDPDVNLAIGQTSEDKEGRFSRSRQMEDMHFSRLSGEKEEVETLSDILGRSACDVYTGENAKSSALLQRESPRILHLATRGFFLSDQEWFSLLDENSRCMTTTAEETPSGKKLDAFENSFLRSGLALAGANRSLAQKGVITGIITAERISFLNLRGTEMVVLSACETGVGEVKSGEGVYVLRRAFTQAGAKSLVMSLWKMPDKEVKELMVSFYTNLQSGKMNRASALRQATLAQRETVKIRYGYDHPYYWGAFVFLGEI